MGRTRVGYWVGCAFMFSAFACGETRDGASGAAATDRHPDGGADASYAEASFANGSDTDGSPTEDASSRDASVDRATTFCSAPYSFCAGACIDPKSDPRNCGECGHACAVGELCSAGKCGLTCLGGATQCGTRCVDIELDPANCGACGAGCDAGEVCYNGKCGVVCLGGTTQCGSICVDPRVDPANCGRCGVACSGSSVCANGACSDRCTGGRIGCDANCVDPTTDLENCGQCGHACPSGQVCSKGQCGTDCQDSVRCGNSCVHPLTDPSNCGGCDHACAIGETCVNGACGLHCAESNLSECFGACVDVSTDSMNCGGCGNVCQSGEHCSAGSCDCGDGGARCQGVCTDVLTNAQNCGVCGVACTVNEACSAGVCECRANTTRCGGVCTDTAISSAHCGACSSPCPAGKVCTDGICAAPTSDWPTFQYDVAHSGVNPNEQGKPPLTKAWSRALGAGLFPPALSGGRLFVTGRTYFANVAPVSVLNVSDGSDLWNYNFGSVFSVGHPSVFGGALYLANGKGTTGNPYLWSFDAASGTVNWSAVLSAQWEQYWAPIRVADTVYTNSGYFGGLYGMAASDGAQRFFTDLDQYDSWSPAYFSDHVFTFIAGHFRKHDPSDGTVISTVEIPWQWSGYSMGTAPVFGTSLGYVVAPPNLVAVDPATDTIAWTANGTYSGTPAVADGAVYAVSGGNLVVRDAATGALLWTFVGDTALSYPPVIASGHVYVASDQNLYAVSIATHQKVDTAAVGGWLVVGSRRLIVAGSDGTLTAFVLAP